MVSRGFQIHRHIEEIVMLLAKTSSKISRGQIEYTGLILSLSLKRAHWTRKKMKAKIYANQMRLGGTAQEFIRQVQNSRHIPVNQTGEPKKAEALGVLEAYQDSNKPPEEIDLGVITGKDMNWQLDNDLMDFRVFPYFFSDLARSKGEGIAEGDSVSLLGDDRIFEVIRISYESESVRIRAEDDFDFTVPWRLIRPLERVI